MHNKPAAVSAVTYYGLFSPLPISRSHFAVPISVAFKLKGPGSHEITPSPRRREDGWYFPGERGMEYTIMGPSEGDDTSISRQIPESKLKGDNGNNNNNKGNGEKGGQILPQRSKAPLRANYFSYFSHLPS